MYFFLKTLHVFSVTLFFGAGIASVFYKIEADRSRDPATIAFLHRTLMRADRLFTIPSGFLLPLTGAGMVYVGGWPWREGWVAWGIALYLLAGVCWLPAFWLQRKMEVAADRAFRDGTPLPSGFYGWTRIWAILGFPAFLAVVLAMYIMVAKGFSFG